jgi:hypothetical protein
MEELVDSVLAAAHPKLRERCDGRKILSVFETIGAYDLDGLGGWLSAAGHFKPEKIAARLRRAANFYRERAGRGASI